jgi:hypothetical protein
MLKEVNNAICAATENISVAAANGAAVGAAAGTLKSLASPTSQEQITIIITSVFNAVFESSKVIGVKFIEPFRSIINEETKQFYYDFIKK